MQFEIWHLNIFTKKSRQKRIFFNVKIQIYTAGNASSLFNIDLSSMFKACGENKSYLVDYIGIQALSYECVDTAI